MIESEGKFQDSSKGMMLLIKLTKDAAYRNVIDAMDEVMINDIKNMLCSSRSRTN